MSSLVNFNHPIKRECSRFHKDKTPKVYVVNIKPCSCAVSVTAQLHGELRNYVSEIKGIRKVL